MLLGRCDMKPVHCALNNDNGDGDDSSIGSWYQIQMSNSTYPLTFFVYALMIRLWFCVYMVYRSIEMFRLSWGELKIEEVIAAKMQFTVWNCLFFCSTIELRTPTNILHRMYTVTVHCTLLFKSKVMNFVIWNFSFLSEIDFLRLFTICSSDDPIQSQHQDRRQRISIAIQDWRYPVKRQSKNILT